MHWCSPPAGMGLENGEVHVWRASLALDPGRIAEFRGWFSPDELVRADRFRFPEHRHHFAAGRGLLRLILSRYTGLKPSDLAFEYGPHGKPALTAVGAAPGLKFNASHSGDLALYAVCAGGEVGVDIEQHQATVECEKLAHRFFSPAEVRALQELQPHERRAAFFTCWSRKEAYIKALGTGLALPLDQFDVSLGPGEPAMLLHTPHDPASVSRWKMWALEPGDGYSAALVTEVTEGAGWMLRCWRFAG